jgi:hypothetical protein
MAQHAGPSYSSRPVPPLPEGGDGYVAVPGVPFSTFRSRGSMPPSPMRNGGSAPRIQHHAHSSSLQVPPKPSTPSVRNQTAEQVQMHALGGGFGPYAVRIQCFSSCGTLMNPSQCSPVTPSSIETRRLCLQRLRQEGLCVAGMSEIEVPSPSLPIAPFPPSTHIRPPRHLLHLRRQLCEEPLCGIQEMI